MLSQVSRLFLVLSMVFVVAMPTPSFAGGHAGFPILRGAGRIVRGAAIGVARVARGAARVVGRAAVGAFRIARGAVRFAAFGLRRTAFFFAYRRPVRRALGFYGGYGCSGWSCGRLRYY